MAKKETRYLSREVKDSLFKKHTNLLHTIYYIGNKIMLKEQLKAIMTILEPLNKQVNESIKELIDYGFLKEKQILTSKKNALYLTSYPISQIEGVQSRNVSCVKPTTDKVLISLLRTEYILELIKKEIVFNTFADAISWVQILEERGNSILLEKSNAIELYELINKNEEIDTYLRKDFFTDKNVCLLEKAMDFNNKSKYKVALKTDEIKALEELNRLKSGYKTLTKVDEKYFFNLKMFLGRNFVLEDIKEIDTHTIQVNISCIDYTNSLDAEKLFNNSGFIYNMFKRYLNKNIKLEVVAFVWNKSNINKLKDKEIEKVKILGSSEYKKHPKGLNALINADVRESELKDIKVNYKTLDIKDKYGIIK